MSSYRLGLLFDLILVIILFCVLPPSDQSLKRTVWDEIAGPYVFSILGWEFDNFFNKWGYSLEQFFIPGKLTQQESVQRVEEYLSLAQNASSLEDTINRDKTEGDTLEADLKSMISRHTSQKIAKGLIWAAAFSALAVMIWILLQVLIEGLPLLSLDFSWMHPGRWGGPAASLRPSSAPWL
jgi:hypothetical protein